MLFTKWSLVSICATTVLISSSFGQTETHPRLFLTPERLDEIKAAIQVEGSHHQQAYAALKARVDKKDLSIYALGTPSPGYDHTALAREAAFMYQITKDTAYASLAFEMVREIMNTVASPTDARRGLARAMTGVGFAIAYDWCYEGWSESRRTWARLMITRALNEWTEFEYPVKGWGEGTNHIWEPYRSNWVAVCQGAQILMTLATYLENSTEKNVYRDTSGAIVPNLSRSERLSTMRSQLLAHVQGAYGNLGVTGEGIGYLAYGSTFLQPIAYALRQLDDPLIDSVATKKQWWQWIMYASSFTKEHFSLQNGCANSGGIGNLGCASLMLATVPQEQLPYYLYWYDRFIGTGAPLTPDRKYDHERAGTVWALIMYPEQTHAKSPTSVLKPMIADTVKGAFFFRNRWVDENDILISFLADKDWEKGVHNVPEAFSLNLVAHGTKYVGSVGRDYKHNLQSSLFIDGKPYDTNHERAASDTGTIEYVNETPFGGYVIADGGQKYAYLGLTSAKRHCKVDFFPNRNKALACVFDDIRASSTHEYSWQLNVGDENGNLGITIDTSREGGRPTFTMNGKDSAYVKGWVLHPADARIDPADPLRIQTRSADAKILVVMLVDSGKVVTGSVSGEGIASKLDLGDALVSVGSSGMIEVTSSQLSAPPISQASQPRRANLAASRDPRDLSLRLSYSGGTGGPMQIHAYDLTGRLLGTMILQREGSHKWNISTHSAPARGAMVVRMSDLSGAVMSQTIVH